MSSLKAHKYRLYPNKKHTEKLQWTLDRARELYNAALQERRDAWQMCKVSITYNQQAAQLPEIKEIRPEYTDIHSQVLQDVPRRAKKAYDNFFRRVKTLFTSFGVAFTVLEPGEEKTAEQELTEGLLSIIASFAGKLYGMCSH